MFGWGWGRWLLVLLGALFLGSYLGWFSWGPVEETIRRLAIRPGVPEILRDSSVARPEALFILLSFLLVTPIAGLIAVFLFVFLLVILAGTLGPVWRMFGLPYWSLVVLLLVVLTGAAYAKNAVWLPWVQRLAGVVAQAYLNMAP